MHANPREFISLSCSHWHGPTQCARSFRKSKLCAKPTRHEPFYWKWKRPCPRRSSVRNEIKIIQIVYPTGYKPQGLRTIHLKWNLPANFARSRRGSFNVSGTPLSAALISFASFSQRLPNLRLGNMRIRRHFKKILRAS